MATLPIEDSVIIGRILSPWGIKGWLQVHSFTDPREGIFNYGPWFVDGSSVEIEGHKVSGKRLVVKLPGVASPEEARSWSQKDICIARDQLPAPQEGEYYWHDLIGMTVINKEQVRLGQISQMLSTGAHDVMEVSLVDSDRTVLIPFVQGTFVDRIDTKAKELIVDWPIAWLDD